MIIEILGRETLAALVGDEDGSRGGRLEAEAGYGFPIADGRFIGTPYLGFGLSDGRWEQRMRYRPTLERGEAVTTGGKLELTTREHADDGARGERAIMLSGEASW